jgi:HSP20 family protein
MLMRFEPFDPFDRFTEQLASERRSRDIPLDAYLRDNEFMVHLELPAADRGLEHTVEMVTAAA